jgi:hypothetical protein
MIDTFSDETYTPYGKVVETAGRFRAVENGCGGYAFEVLDGGKWHRFGNDTSDRRNASIKISRLAGHRDTDKDTVEGWAAFYRVNV